MATTITTLGGGVAQSDQATPGSSDTTNVRKTTQETDIQKAVRRQWANRKKLEEARAKETASELEIFREVDQWTIQVAQSLADEKRKARQKVYYQKRKEKAKAYYEAHKEEKKDYQRQYREAHEEELKVKDKARNEGRKEELLAYQKMYRETHKEELKAKRKARYEASKATKQSE